MKAFQRLSLSVLGLAMTVATPVAQEESSLARPALVVTVEQSSAQLERSYPAIVLPSREVELSFRVSGQLIELPVRGAMQVEEGDIIARLDPRDFESRITQLQSQRDQADAQLRALRSGGRPEEIASLEASVAAAEAQFQQALDQVARTQQLADRGVVSSAQLEQDQAALRVAEAQLEVQQEQLAIGQAGGRQEELDAAEAALQGIDAQLDDARAALEDATLMAPFTGIIARRDLENFSNVQAGQSVVLLQSLDVVDLLFDVPGPDVTAIASANQGDVSTTAMFDGLPGDSFDAELVEFSTQADASTQTYRGRVAVDLPDGSLILPGMVGQVTTTVPAGEPELLIPLTAIGADAGGATVVWVVGDDGVVASRPVVLGAASGDSVIVDDGLASGETIVAAGVSQLTEGMSVRPISRIGG